ncbi:hypothetical protein [Streptomyces sp. NPDC056817]
MRCTATWHRSTPPTEPEYWRAAATAPVEHFASPVSSAIRIPSPASPLD